MTKIQLRAYRRTGDSIHFDLAKPPPFPSETHEIRTTAEAQTLLDDYADRAKELGQPMALSVMHKEGRRPAGFKQLEKGWMKI